MLEIKTNIFLGDCNDFLKNLPDNSVDLIFTSPPYADQRKSTYGGVHPDDYVNWFLPISAELLRVLKPTGTFIPIVRTVFKNRGNLKFRGKCSYQQITSPKKRFP